MSKKTARAIFHLCYDQILSWKTSVITKIMTATSKLVFGFLRSSITELNKRTGVMMNYKKEFEGFMRELALVRLTLPVTYSLDWKAEVTALG